MSQARAFLEGLASLPRPDRESAILAARELWVECEMVEIGSSLQHGVSLQVTSDVFSLGTQDDPIRIPLSGPGAQRLADLLGLSLITPAVSDLTWKAAQVRIDPEPWGPPYDASMLSIERLLAYNDRVERERGGRPGLIAGHKKDVVQWDPKHPERVVIYGWHQPNGHPIQQVYPGVRDAAGTGHELAYADYSHAVRLMTFDPDASRYPT